MNFRFNELESINTKNEIHHQILQNLYTTKKTRTLKQKQKKLYIYICIPIMLCSSHFDCLVRMWLAHHQEQALLAALCNILVGLFSRKMFVPSESSHGDRWHWIKLVKEKRCNLDSNFDLVWTRKKMVVFEEFSLQNLRCALQLTS